MNAIGNSSYWANTAIIVTWDDWGGWYDHVPPPQVIADDTTINAPLSVSHFLNDRTPADDPDDD